MSSQNEITAIYSNAVSIFAYQLEKTRRNLKISAIVLSAIALACLAFMANAVGSGEQRPNVTNFSIIHEKCSLVSKRKMDLGFDIIDCERTQLSSDPEAVTINDKWLNVDEMGLFVAVMELFLTLLSLWPVRQSFLRRS